MYREFQEMRPALLFTTLSASLSPESSQCNADIRYFQPPPESGSERLFKTGDPVADRLLFKSAFVM